MTESTEKFADRSYGVAAASGRAVTEPPNDLLSVILRSVRLRGEEVFCCAPASPFAISFPGGGALHIVSQGEFNLQLEGESATHHCQRGDVVLIGGPHSIRHGRRTTARPLDESDLRFEVVTHGEGTRWLAGTFSCDISSKADLVQSLPPVIRLPGAGDQSLLWLDVSTQMLMKEMTEPSQGSREMISRILDLLFIQVLRSWATGADATPGWLTGAMDPVVGEAVTAIHADPAHPWTIEQLAAKSHLSRTAFALRFARRVGQPPAAYIAQVRLSNAAELLLDSVEPVGVVATRCGYQSEAAFSRAFSRRYGMPPLRWRRQAGR